MAGKPRLVFDTNVIVSALLLRNSVARRAFDKAVSSGEILLSLEVIEELYDVLRRPAFDKYVSEEERLQFLTLLVREASLINVTEKVTACRDPKDDKFLELAINGQADCIVTGDGDLQVLSPFRGIAILPPDVFVKKK